MIKNAGFFRETSGLFALFLAMTLLVACQTTIEDVDKFKDAVNGHAKLMEIMQDESVEPAVRSYAAVSLIKENQVEKMYVALKGMPADQQVHLIMESARSIGELFRNPDLGTQAAAKDALFLFMQMGVKPIEKSSLEVILNWYSSSFDIKYSAGTYSAFVVLTYIGKAATPLLHKLIVDPAMQKMQSKIIKIIEKIDDPELAGLTSDYFIAQLNKQAPNFEQETLDMLRVVRDDRVTEILNNFAADKKNDYRMREAVLDTLRFKPSKLSIPAATRIFMDKSESIDMRGLAIEIIQESGDEEVVKFLMPFIRDENVKWAVFGAILKIGKEKHLKEVFDKLDPTATFWRGDYDVARRHLKNLPPEAAAVLAPYLKSKQIPLTTLALIGLQYTATPAQAEEWIKPMLEDARIIPNYHSQNKISLGKLAQEIYERIKTGADKQKEIKQPAENEAEQVKTGAEEATEK